MSGPINPAAPGRHVACYIVSGDNEGVSSDNGGETSIGQGSARQAGGWLHRVRLDAPYGVCTLPAVAALKDGSDSVCELEYCPLPPVCVADDEAQAADAAKARAVGRGETLDCPDTREMPPCPSEWDDSGLPGWKSMEAYLRSFIAVFVEWWPTAIPIAAIRNKNASTTKQGNW